jgi:hypothetical protein
VRLGAGTAGLVLNVNACAFGAPRAARRRAGAPFPSSACKFLLSRASPTDGKLEQIRFQFWVALSFGEPCAIFGSFQIVSRMFSHDRTVPPGAIEKVIGWAAGSVPLRLQQLNSGRKNASAEEQAPVERG